MKIEILFPEFCNLYGDSCNVTYLKQSLPEAEFIYTSYEQEPAFVSQEVQFIYMGTMTESAQEAVIQKLKVYKKQIEKSIENHVVWLVTGNAIEVFGEYIEKEDGTRIEGVSLFPVHAKRDMMHRHNSLFLGKIEDIEVIGFKSQFSMLYGNNEENYFLEVEKGIGICPKSKLEGIRKHNFFATYVLGPILIVNPKFTKWLLQKAGIENPELAYEEDAMKAYEIRYKEFVKKA